MMKPIHEVLSQIRVGAETTFENLTLIPLLRDTVGEPDYVTLDEALRSKRALVRELGHGGSVPELEFVNEGDRPVLILDGEELVGAKQNRILNLTVLAPAAKTTVIPVSCVEAGRWAFRSRTFDSSPRAYYAGGRSEKMAQVSMSMERSGRRESDQGAVWQSVAAKSARLGSQSPTGAMAAMYDVHAQPIEKYVSAFAPLEQQVGAAFAIGGRLVGLDLFDYPRTLAELLPKLVRSYALDAVDELIQASIRPAAAPAEHPPLGAALDAFLVDLSHARAESYPAVGLGEDVRLSGNRLAGGALLVGQRVVHLAAFRSPDRDHEGVAQGYSRMTRSSARVRRQQ